MASTTHDSGQTECSLKVLLLSTNVKDWACPALYYEQQAILQAMPGSVIYGPGFQFNTNSVPEIIREVYGDSGPDVIVCYMNERRLLGEPIDDQTTGRFGLDPDLRVFPVGLDRVDVPKIAWVNDYHHSTREMWDNALLRNGIQFVFATYCPPFGRVDAFNHFFSSRVFEAVRFVPWPRAMPPELFRDYGLEKVHDVALLGAVDENIYPLRHAMHDAFSKEPGISYYHRQHPGYRYVESKPALVGEAYARVINQSRIFASCSSVFRFPLMKIYEVLGCRSMLLTDPPFGAEHLGLEDGQNFVAVDTQDFLDKARWYLANEDEIDRISNNGRELFLSRHTADIRAQEFREVISALLSGRDPGSYAALVASEDLGRSSRSFAVEFAKWQAGPSDSRGAWRGSRAIRRCVALARRVIAAPAATPSAPALVNVEMDRDGLQDSPILDIDWTHARKPLIGIIKERLPVVDPYWTKFAAYCEANSLPYEFYNAHGSDWVEEGRRFDVIAWRVIHAYGDDVEARDKLYVLDKCLGKTCFPSYHEAWHYNDKIRQTYLYETHGLPHIPTFISYRQEEAELYIESCCYPIVWKLSTGAGSTNVGLIKSKSEALKFVRRAFEGKDHPGNRAPGYVYFQDFVDEAKYDLRIIVVGDYVMGYYRRVPEGGFKASGAGLYEKRAIPYDALALACRAKAAMEGTILAVDLIDAADGYKIIESSTFFQVDTPEQLHVDGQPGRYVRQGEHYVFQPGRYWVQHLVMDEVVKQWLAKQA